MILTKMASLTAEKVPEIIVVEKEPNVLCGTFYFFNSDIEYTVSCYICCDLLNTLAS